MSRRSKARIIDGKLILSMPGALTPVVWQMDLGDAKSSALMVHEKAGDAAAYALMLKTARGESLEIAAFGDQHGATKALKSVFRALEKGQGKIRPGQHQPGVSTAGRVARWGVGIAAVVIIALFLTGLLAGRTQSPGTLEPASGNPGNESMIEDGVPMSADAFLKGAR